MVYVMSDIHGEADRFYKVLEEINFCDDDQLFVIGDVIDRGADGVDLLFDIMSRPNVTMLLGNHEQMMLDTLGRDPDPAARSLWVQNGGSKTRRDLLYHRTSADRRAILRFCDSLPVELSIELDGREYILIHGAPGKHPIDKIWNRVTPDSAFHGATYIVGHTPTCFLTGRGNEPYRIYHGNGFIDIDCGCGNMNNPYRALACLRLNDMEEFYI